MKITEHVSYREATKSNTAIRKGIENIPSEEQMENIKLICEKVFKPIYGDALTKVLGTLIRETKGQIKVGKKTMPYKDVLQNKQEMKTLTEIDITDFEFDPKNDALRFNRGGLAA